MKAARTIFEELVPFAVAVAIWQALAMAGIWPKVLFPSPLEVAQTFATDLASGVLLVNLAVSLKSLLLGFVVGCAIAVPLGYLMGLSRASRNFFDPLVNLLQAIPGLAWIPFAILWFGLGQGAVTFIIVMSVFFPVLHNLLTGIRMVQPVLIEAVRTLGADRGDVIRHVIFPATLPNLMTGIRLGIAFGFRSLVGGEMIASTDGLGYAIFNAQQYFQSARIVVGMLAIGIVWLAMDRLILRPIEQRTTMRWGLVREGLEQA
jgi:NitT/TauT family transport system permease protein/taurine transport system permease protein